MRNDFAKNLNVIEKIVQVAKKEREFLRQDVLYKMHKNKGFE